MAQAEDNPWLKAKVGDWVSYETVTSGMKVGVKWTVTAKTATSLTYAIETSMMGQVVKSNQTIDFKSFAAAAKATKAITTEETITVAGQSWKCKKVETNDNGVKNVTWLNTDLAMGGLIKSETSGPVTMTMTLVDWGPK